MYATYVRVLNASAKVRRNFKSSYGYVSVTGEHIKVYNSLFHV